MYKYFVHVFCFVTLRWVWKPCPFHSTTLKGGAPGLLFVVLQQLQASINEAHYAAKTFTFFQSVAAGSGKKLNTLSFSTLYNDLNRCYLEGKITEFLNIATLKRDRCSNISMHKMAYREVYVFDTCFES